MLIRWVPVTRIMSSAEASRVPAAAELTIICWSVCGSSRVSHFVGGQACRALRHDHHALGIAVGVATWLAGLGGRFGFTSES